MRGTLACDSQWVELDRVEAALRAVYGALVQALGGRTHRSSARVGRHDVRQGKGIWRKQRQQQQGNRPRYGLPACLPACQHRRRPPRAPGHLPAPGSLPRHHPLALASTPPATPSCVLHTAQGGTGRPRQAPAQAEREAGVRAAVRQAGLGRRAVLAAFPPHLEGIHHQRVVARPVVGPRLGRNLLVRPPRQVLLLLGAGQRTCRACNAVQAVGVCAGCRVLHCRPQARCQSSTRGGAY